MSTSSARPDDLDAWATASRSLDEVLETRRSTLATLHTEFTTSSSWGAFDASSMLGGFRSWLYWNEIDAQWVGTIATAFRNAGAGTVPDAVIAGLLASSGLDVTRLSVTYDDPIALGEPPTSGYANDPVNTATGNFVEVEVDLAARGLVRLAGFARTYNSRSDRDGPFGPGWASWATARLRAEPDGAHWEAADGQRAVIARDEQAAGGPSYRRVVGIPGLVVPAGDGLALAGFGGGRLTFDRDGRPLSASDGPGTTVRFRHDGDRLVGLRHDGGTEHSLEWDGARVTSVRSSDGRAVTYRYDDGGRLVEAAGPAGARRYEIDDRGRVVAVTDADGVVEVRNTYDDEGRVTRQASPHGRRTRFRYVPGRVTIVDDDAGGPANSYVHDDHGRLVGVVDGHGAEMVKQYDGWGNPVVVTERDGATTLQRWDERGRLLARRLPGGATFAFGYDEHDRVVEVTAPGGAVTLYRYDGDERTPSELVDPEGGVTVATVDGGLVRGVVDPDGVEVRFAFDDRGELTAVTDAAGNTARIERDAAGRVVATVSPTGLRTELVHDAAGRVVERHDPGGAVTRFEWSAAGRLVGSVDPLGARTEVVHGADGEAVQVVDPLGHVTTRRFDAFGNLVGVVLPDGAKWEFTYDGLCRLVGIDDPAGATWLREYDRAGHLVGSVDPMGVHRTATVDGAGRITAVDDGLTSVGFEFDELGRPTAHHRPDGTEMHAGYDRCGRLVEVTDATGGVSRYERTPAGRLAAVVSPLGAVTRYDRDRCGRPVAVVGPGGQRWTYRYDGDSRVTQVVAPTGEIERFRYDDGGRLAARVSAAGGVTSFIYDAAGRPTAVTDPTGGVRRFGWDLRGDLATATDPNGGVVRCERDERGFVRTLVDPLGGRVEQRHDAVGRLVARTDVMGRTTSWEYDAAGRPTRQVLPTGERVRWWYDGSGRVRAIGADDPVVRIERDRLGRPVVIDEPGMRHELSWEAAGRLVARRRNGLGLTWRYDADGRRIATGLPDGSETTTHIDPAGRPTAVAHPALAEVTFEHDPAGRLVARRAGAAGVTERWRYRNGAIAGHEVERDGRARATEVERDAAGRVVAATTDGVRREYAYDAGGQLVAAAGPDGRREYRYDRAGRLVAESGPAGDVAYLYDAAHQLIERRSAAATHRYDYDAAGRRIREHRAGVAANGDDGTGRDGDGSMPGRSRRFTWDWLGRLSGVAGTRLTVDVAGDLAEVDGRPLLWDPVGAVPQLRWVDGVAVVGGDEPWAAVDAAGAVSWFDRDERGSVRPDGATAAPDPWGGAPGPAGALGTPHLDLGLRGELTVDGLVWLRHRAYDPGTRSFLSTDPLPGLPGDPVWANPYHYAGNDPVGAVDPLGLRPMTEADLAAYRESAGGNLFDRAGDWVGDNWEYIAAGALIVGGVLVMATGVGGPIGAAMIGGALLSGGISAGSQRMMTGEVDWGQVGVDMAIGALGGGTGAALTSTTTVARVATTTIGRGVIVGGTEGLVSGAAYQGINYARTGEFDPGAVARDTLLGGITGGAGAHIQERAVLGPLRRVGPDTFESPNTGLVYGPDPRNGNRVNHVLRHTVDDPGRALHGVFSGDQHVFDVIDDAYTRTQTATTGVMREPTQTLSNGTGVRDRSVVTMDDTVGYVGGSNGAAANNPSSSHVRLVVDNANQLVTSFPEAGIPMGR